MTTKARRRWVMGTGCLVLAIVLAGYGFWTLRRPLPALLPEASVASLELRTDPSNLTWPGTEQSAVGIIDSGILETHGAQTPAPTASTAKLITALTVLRDKPLNLGQQGPEISLTASDAALYAAYVAKGGSVVPVQAGEQISEYQMLETLLLPSANNMADSLAIWAYGSLDAYATAANQYLAKLDLNSTHVGSDASGFTPDTTSTAHDLVRLGEIAMQNPVLAQIAGQSTAAGIPLAGTVKNINSLLGTDGIIGVKTGNTDQAGGVFVSASRTSINDKPITIVTAVIGAPDLSAALRNTVPLVKSAQANFSPVSVIKTGAVVGHYRLPWGGSIDAVASKDLSLSSWDGSLVGATINLRSTGQNPQSSQTVGSLTVPSSATTAEQTVNIKLQTTPPKPSVWWRLFHF